MTFRNVNINRHLKINEWLLLVAYVSLFFSVINPPKESFAANIDSKKALITIEAKQEPLRNVLKKISKASGYEIQFNTQFGNSPVSLNLDNVTLREAIARVLKNYNHIAVWEEKKRKLVIFIFKDKGPQVSITGKNRIFEQATETTGN